MKPQRLPDSVIVKQLLRLKAEHESTIEAIELVRTFEKLDATYVAAKSAGIPPEMLRRLYRLIQDGRDKLADVKSVLLDPSSWIDMWAAAGEANAARFAAAGAAPEPFTPSRTGRPVALPRSKALQLIDKAIGRMDARLLTDLAPYAPPED